MEGCSERGDPSLMKEGFSKTVHLRSEGHKLNADWVMPPDPLGIVLFAHGSGSSRHSSRNKAVARYLVGRGMGTLLLDLLTPMEEEIDSVTGHLRFDIPLLARRLADATRWLQDQAAARGIPIGYFGASTGGGAALLAAGELGGEIAAVVSRGGRPDLAGSALPKVSSPTLLLVGGNDEIVVKLNRKALARLTSPKCIKELAIIPGATHLFEEPGMLDQVAVRAADWFTRHFAQHRESHRKECATPSLVTLEQEEGVVL